MPASWAIFAMASKSGTSSLGFPIVSAYIALVLGVIAFLISSGFVESTNFTVLPSLGKV
jgi:amino acid permease